MGKPWQIWSVQYLITLGRLPSNVFCIWIFTTKETMKLLVVGWSVISDLCTFSPASHLGLMVSLCLGDWIPFQHADEVGGRSQAAPPLAPQWGCQMRTNMFNSSFYRSFKRLVVLQLWTGWLCLPTQSHWIRLIGIKKDAAKPCYSCAREVSVQSTFAVKLLAQKLVTSGSFFWSPKKVFLDIHMMPARNQMIFKKVYFWQDFDSERRKTIGEKCSRIRAAPFNCIHRSITIQPAIH